VVSKVVSEVSKRNKTQDIRRGPLAEARFFLCAMAELAEMNKLAALFPVKFRGDEAARSKSMAYVALYTTKKRDLTANSVSYCTKYNHLFRKDGMYTAYRINRCIKYNIEACRSPLAAKWLYKIQHRPLLQRIPSPS
jgi:hypothetical protein